MVTDDRELFNELTKAYVEAKLLEPKKLYRELRDRHMFLGTLISAGVRQRFSELMREAMKLHRGGTVVSGGIGITKLTYAGDKNPELQVDILLPNRMVKSHRSFIISLNPGSGNPLLRETTPTNFSKGHLSMPSLEARSKR